MIVVLSIRLDGIRGPRRPIYQLTLVVIFKCIPAMMRERNAAMNSRLYTSCLQLGWMVYAVILINILFPISNSARPANIKISPNLTHWGQVTHICVSILNIIGSDNGLSPGRRQAIIWTNAGILLIGPLGTNLSEISIEIHIFSFTKIHLKVSFRKWRPFCLGLNVLRISSANIRHKLSL